MHVLGLWEEAGIQRESTQTQGEHENSEHTERTPVGTWIQTQVLLAAG